MDCHNNAGFGAIIPAFLDDYPLDPFEFRLFARIQRRSGYKDCFESLPNMAKGCHMSLGKARFALRVLIECQLITAHNRASQGKTYLCTINPIELWVKADKVATIRQKLTPGKSDTPTESDRGTEFNTPTESDTPPLSDPIGKGIPINESLKDSPLPPTGEEDEEGESVSPVELREEVSEGKLVTHSTGIILPSSGDSKEVCISARDNKALCPGDNNAIENRDNKNIRPKRTREGDKYFGATAQQNHQRSLAAKLQNKVIPIEEQAVWGSPDVYAAFEAYLLEKAKAWKDCKDPAALVYNKLKDIASRKVPKTEFTEWQAMLKKQMQREQGLEEATQPALTLEEQVWTAIVLELQNLTEVDILVDLAYKRDYWDLTSNLPAFNGRLDEAMEKYPLTELPSKIKSWYSECYSRAKAKHPHLAFPAPLA